MSDIDGISHCKTHDIIEQICTISITKQKCFIMFNVALLFMNIILLFKLCIHQDDIVMRINKNNKITRTYRKLALNMNSSSRTKALAYITWTHACLPPHICMLTTWHSWKHIICWSWMSLLPCNFGNLDVFYCHWEIVNKLSLQLALLLLAFLVLVPSLVGLFLLVSLRI